ncbi:NAD(P)-dependent oxidoreductase [Deinococcus sp.]|uniref:NAD(P)-dependent oxidoreductase n=1 Tax=Deinococcus sp. TaxID=47478 RepID=UPI003B5C4A5C
MNESIGLIGLGDLGQPVARNLLASGYPLTVYNRTASKTEPLVALGAEAAARPSEAVTIGGTVLTIVADDAALESVVMSEGFLEALGEGGVHLSMSTVSLALSRKLAALHAQHGSSLIEAPVFGRPEAAAARQLWICTAGPQAAKQRVQPVLDALGQGTYDFGEAIGAALTVKLAGNFMILSAGLAITEALKTAKASGVDPVKVIEMLTQTLFPAPIYQSYGQLIAADPDRMMTNWIGQKDMGLFRALSAAVGADTPLASLLQEQLQAAADS